MQCQSTAVSRTCAASWGGAEGAFGALVFEAHADSLCRGPRGARCFVRALPSGTAVRVAKALTFDAQFNDVRSRAAARPFWVEVALRRARGAPRAAAMLTAGNASPGVEDRGVGALKMTLAKASRAPSVYAFGYAFPAAAGGGAAAEVLDVHVHSHQRYARSAYVLSAPLASLDLPPLPAP